ncbi:MAG: hypothetical protein ACI8TQ_001442 [Planctomycetota bacterium]|jgi:hypothetical protein
MKHSDPNLLDTTRKLRVLSTEALRPRCLVTDMHPERGLSRSLCMHLGEAIPNLEFSLDEVGGFESIWVCGYEPDQVDRVQALRRRYPDARILVTGGRSRTDWQNAALRAGADSAREWPLSQVSLKHLLMAEPNSRVCEAG